MKDAWSMPIRTFLGWWALLALLWGAGLWQIRPWDARTPALLLGGVVCLGAALADWRSHRLPDVFTLGGGVLLLAAYVWLGLWKEAALGAGLGFAALKSLQFLLRRLHPEEEHLGSGDAKLMLPLGIMTGPGGLLPTLLLACLFALSLSLLRRAAWLPFGPALVAGAFMTVMLALQWPI